MRANRLHLICFFSAAILVFGCKKTEDLQTDQISDYMPTVTGKYITYRMDSTVFTNFGRNTEIHSYQEKNVIDAQITDGLGRPSYRVYRYIRDTTGTKPWQPAGSYLITSQKNTVEVIENNLRVIKLTLPIKENNTWKGNRFLPDEAYSSFYSFNNDLDMATWDYTYSSLGETVSLNGRTLNDVVTVEGVDDLFNVPVTDPNVFAYINRIQDKYAKGIGLVYQEFTMWEYQPNTGGQGGGFKIGFGVKRSMIDHN